MNVKVIAGCCYLAFAYWLASAYSSLHTLFFPTLGAFCFLIGSRPSDWKGQLNTLSGAFVASVVGCLFHYISRDAWSMIAASLLTMWLIKACKWNAPPIAAIALIPFYLHQDALWLEPIFVLCGVGGLFLSFWIAESVIVPIAAPLLGPRLLSRWRKPDARAVNERVRTGRSLRVPGIRQDT